MSRMMAVAANKRKYSFAAEASTTQLAMLASGYLYSQGTALALDGPGEVADHDIGQFLFERLDQRLHAEGAAHARQRGHARQQDFGIDVQIGQLDQAQT